MICYLGLWFDLWFAHHGFPYSLPSVRPGADPGVQAVSLQVTINHPSGSSRLPLLSARPAVTFPVAEHHHPLAGYMLFKLPESNGSLPPGGWLSTCGLTACTVGSAQGPTKRSVMSMGSLYLFRSNQASARNALIYSSTVLFFCRHSHPGGWRLQATWC